MKFSCFKLKSPALKCCSCCTLRTEALIIGWLKSVFLLLCTITSCYYLITSLSTDNACGLLKDAERVKCEKVLELTYVGIPTSFILSLPQMLLVYAVQKNSTQLLTAWLYIEGVTIIFDCCGIVVGLLLSEIALYSSIASFIVYFYSFLRVLKLNRSLAQGASPQDLDVPEVEASV